MPRTVDREEVKRLQAGGAQLVEVLPPKEFQERHLKGAVNIPLEELDSAAAARLDRNREVIVYCDDFQ